LQEMATTAFSNQTEKRAFLKSLERIIKRLADVEENGYSPPERQRSPSIVESEDSSELPKDDQDQFETAASRKRKKKKGKKKVPQQQAPKGVGSVKSTSASVASSQDSFGPEKHEEDPMVMALLGMGFTHEQIMEAAKACGGMNRATADDLVAWIFGQVDGADNTAEETEQNDISFEVIATTAAKPSQKKNADASREEEVTRKSSESDPKREKQEAKEKEAAARLAAKREEKRRRNREWNNREQARQEEEANAKMDMAMKVQAAPAAPTYTSAAYSGLQMGLPNGLQTGFPNDLQTGLNTGLHTGLPVPPGHAIPQPHQFPVVAQSSANPANVVLNQPMMHALPPQALPNLIGNQYPIPQMAFPNGGSIHLNPRMPNASPYGFPPMFDDDRTVSSLGSSHTLSSNLNLPPSAVPPPGFRPGPTGPTSKPLPQQNFLAAREEILAQMQAEADVNMLGEIRATAKAFVPTNFTPSMTATGPPPGVGTSFSGTTNFYGAHTQHNAHLPQSSHLPPGMLLAGSGGPHHTVARGLPNSFDRAAAVTPMSDMRPPLRSATSSLPVEEPSISRPLGFGHQPMTGSQGAIGGSSTHGAVRGSSILDSISNGPPVGGSSIWGESQPAPSLTGLTSFGFGEPGRDMSNTGENNDNLLGENNAGQGWGLGGGSIW
jgi:hypothetical protein